MKFTKRKDGEYRATALVEVQVDRGLMVNALRRAYWNALWVDSQLVPKPMARVLDDMANMDQPQMDKVVLAQIKKSGLTDLTVVPVVPGAVDRVIEHLLARHHPKLGVGSGE